MLLLEVIHGPGLIGLQMKPLLKALSRVRHSQIADQMLWKVVLVRIRLKVVLGMMLCLVWAVATV